MFICCICYLLYNQCLIIVCFFFYLYGDPRDLHVLTHSFPTRRSSDLSSLAPPCAGPQRQAMPAAMQANGLAPDEPAERTVLVEAFCSWSACRMKMRSMALVRTGFGFQSSAGTEKHKIGRAHV